MNKPKVSIVIVNWNAGNLLRDCVESVIRYGQQLVSEIIVVNNDSTDGSEIMLQNIPEVTVIQAGENLGFAKACNLGAKQAQGDYLLFLNPDTRLFENSLLTPINFMQQSNSSDIGICGIQLVDEEGRISTSAARFPTLNIFVGKTLGLAKLFPNIFLNHLMSPDELHESKVVDQVIGAFFLIRRSVFYCCQGFDERFFVYFEEVDLSLRAKKLGYSSYYLSNATAFHKGGGCSEKVKAARLFYSLRSRVLYAQKHYSAISYVLLIGLTAVELPLRLIQSVFRKSWSDAANTLIAYRQLFSYFLWGR